MSPDGVVKFIRGAAGAGASDLPDAELVRRFASAGDEQAFRALVARYGPVVWSVCRRLVRDHHDAEDAFQATLLVFARRAGDLCAGAAIGGWLYAVANRVASRVRSARRVQPVEADPTDGPAGGALDELTVREAESALHAELAGLPEKYRAPLVLCCLEGLSRDEAAARLGFCVTPLAILLNDTRAEVAFEHLEVAAHVVLMLTKSKGGAWQVKDIDFRDWREVEERVKLYLGGAYDEKPAKK